MRVMVAVSLSLLFVLGVCGQDVKKESAVEIDVGKILWRLHSGATKYFGKPIGVVPPATATDGWEYLYPNGNETVEAKDHVLLIVHKYKERPRDYKEALRMVGLPTDVPPAIVGTEYMWLARGVYKRPIRLRRRILNRVILAKDFSVIVIDGHWPGTY